MRAAGEVMAVVQAAMLAGMPFTGLRDAILTHPTMAEGLNTLFSDVPPRLDTEFDGDHPPAGAQNRV